MRNVRRSLISSFALLIPSAGLVLLPACSRPTTPLQAATAIEPVVLTTMYPTAWVTEQLLGGAVPVINLLPPGEDPAHWQPPTEVLTRCQNAALVVLNGASFESWAASASLPAARTVDSALDLPGGFVIRKGVTHSHGTAGSHSHEGVDGHTWLDPINLAHQAGRIKASVLGAFPEHAPAIASNHEALVKRLAALDAEFKDLAERLEGFVIVTSHPAYGYLARRYGWSVRELDLDPALPYSLGTAQEVTDALGDHPAARAIMLWESQPTDAAMFERLRDAVGVASVVFAPVESLDPADRAAGKDYLALMRDNLARVREVIAELPAAESP